MPAKSSKKVQEKKKNEEKKIEVVEEEEDVEEDIDFNDEEEEFFDKDQFKHFDEKIKFHVFDPNKYENEIHREIKIVPNKSRKTSEVITKFEFTDVVSNRAKQIEDGSKIFVDIKNESNPIKMAEMEIRMKSCPLSIRRMISGNIAEIWEVNEMIIPY